MKIKISRNAVFILAHALILGLLLTSGMTSSTVTIICVVLACALFLIESETQIVASLLFLYSFYCLFKFGGQGVSYYNFIMAFAVVVLFLKGKKDYNKDHVMGKNSFSLLVILVVYAFIVNLIMQGDLGINTILFDLLIPFLLIIVIRHQLPVIAYKYVLYAYAIGIIIAGVVGSGLISLNHINNYIDLYHYRVGSLRLARLQGLTVNPNYYSVDVNIALSALFILGKLQKRAMSSFEYILIIMLSVIGFMTLSKTFVLVFLVSIMLLLIAPNQKVISNKTIAFGALSTVVMVWLFSAGNDVVLAVVSRFELAGDLSSLTSSRSDIWLAYLKNLIQNPLQLFLGNGISAENLYIGNAGNYMPSHNVYIEIIYFLGIVGGLLLVSFIYYSLGFYHKHKKIVWIPLIVLALRMFAINLLLREAFANLMIVIMVLLYASRINGEEAVKE